MPPKATTGPYIPRPLPQKPVPDAVKPARPMRPADIRKTKEYKSAARKCVQGGRVRWWAFRL
ncbi:uncharacterized protein N7477_001811 [Penicillium maclennaniae]|uniref:uncharacterized protein n=1 Tax=Penicillium maclennaniae TaxID=1343394 RepID=UPI00253FEE04|nr:uncharacterized protein N7477_001811 [Penicillium maclennaniae]KAJ5681871.1 hypothetical protein N7477_001811 [Penicillium maclennaniae]